MRFSLVAAALALASALPSQAMFSSISVPSGTYKPGDTLDVTVRCRETLTNNEQDYAVFGVTPASSTLSGELGYVPFGYTDLRALGLSNNGFGDKRNITVKATIPKDLEGVSGAVSLNMAVFMLGGELHGASVQHYYTNITLA